MNFLEELKWRNLVKDVTDEESLAKRMQEPMTVYCGFDPTADSLHIGHLQQILLLKRYLNAGHQPIALIGGGTGMIGDPRPTSERSLQSLDTIGYNAKSIQKQIENIIAIDGKLENVTVLNNYEWLKDLSLLDFLRDYGKYFNINTMIAKDTIASRLDTGISFTEFTYTILQALDWLHLLDHHHCEVQIGGSDQWGNLLSGTELIRKVHQGQKTVFGITSPLITKSDGSKFGKSEGENVWLDPNRTDAYTFYQFWINVSDDDVDNFMRRLSMKSVDEIKNIIEEHQKAPHLRLAQKELAAELMQNPETIIISRDENFSSKVEHIYFVCEERDKIELVRKICRMDNVKALAFANDMNRLSVLAEKLTFRKLLVKVLHSETKKQDRAQAIRDFRAGKFPLLLATDVAARGLDIKGLTHVIQLDLPKNIDQYIHRAGRTGRAGASGIVISIVTPREEKILQTIAKKLKIKIEKKQLYKGKIVAVKK